MIFAGEMMLELDGSKIIEEVGLIIETPFGITDVTHLSTSMKTRINVYNLRKQGIEFTMAIQDFGPDKMKVLCKIVDDSKIRLYVGRSISVFIGHEEF